MASIFSKLFSRTRAQPSAPDACELNYDGLILLDAEDLAEQGIASAYHKLLPELSKYVEQPAPIEEIVDSDLPSYSVRCAGVDYLIYSPQEAGTERESWGRATYYFFLIVNSQLEGAPVRLYAVNGGNDLGALFLEPDHALAVRQSIMAPSDWPYIPALSPPMYGQHR